MKLAGLAGRLFGTVLVSCLLTVTSSAFIVSSNLRGVVHDSQHRPIARAHAMIEAAHSSFSASTETNAEGIFEFAAVPAGEYTVTVKSDGFASAAQMLEITSGNAAVLHYQLNLATVEAKVTVVATSVDGENDTPARTTLISREEIARYAGADSANSLRMVTEFIPGAYIVHDQLHVRGGHQVSWAIDGVPLPNTNIASNVGPQVNPKDVDYLEAQTGAYAADYGDRTYAVLNVATRTGFERNREAELVTSLGSFLTTDDQLSFGDHSERLAYYASLSGNRTDYGLEPETHDNLHNRAAGGGAFASLLYNASAADQIRFTGAGRADYYQVPNDRAAQDALVRDREREQDASGTLTWLHTVDSGVLVSVSPFYHFNRAAFEGGPADQPIAVDNRGSKYEGGQVSISAVKGSNDARVGLYAFAQQDNTFFSVVANDGSGDAFQQRNKADGQLEAAFAQDQIRLRDWLTLSGGVRLTHFAGRINENSADPRVGVAIRVPHLQWVLRASYSRFYQAPPLDALSGPLLKFAATQGATFLPLRGERDEQHEIGLMVPVKGWTADISYFRIGARNYFDHDVIGDSNIFFPLTIAAARIRGWESTLRSPLLRERYHAHLVYSNQQAEGFGGVTGGLSGFTPPPTGGFYLDHDQRNTLSAGLDGRLPWRMNAALDVNYGSGFLTADGPAHLPSYRTFDFSLNKELGERFNVRASVTNLTDKRYQLDESNTFGGSHIADPRRVEVQARYRFRY